jgi:aspartyl-tRNA synthetase
MSEAIAGGYGTPVPAGMRTHYCGRLGTKNIGETVSVCGWVAHRREHGEHLAFIDLRDYSGLIQCVVDGAQTLRSEFVVRITGVVRARPVGTENTTLATGAVEIGDSIVEILNVSEPTPFVLDGYNETDESVRLRHRYIDLRSQKMQHNLRLRARVSGALRRSMEDQGFVEIETPLLWTPTPEGAREFAVPSRLQHGSFYVLPQSPQIAKQLTMVGGFDRYFQIARCLRDEDLRADRQFEFTQLDIEASFVTETDIRSFVAKAVAEATYAVDGQAPDEIVEMTWHEAMDRYGTDKPDLRFGMELVDITTTLAKTEFNAFRAACVKAIRIPGGAEFSRAKLDDLTERAKSLGAKGLGWLRTVTLPEGVLDLESPITKFLSESERTGMIQATGVVKGDLLLIVADEHRVVCTVLGQLRVDLGRPPVHEGPRRFCWVIDFPMFEGIDDEGNLIAAHHPFTMPHDADLDLLDTDPLSVRAQSYDLVLNGWELGSGSIRIHRSDIQAKVFSVLGVSDEEAEARFGFLLGAFRYGAPPHGGFAVGLDRFVAILAGEENIREVIAFPKTQSGTDLMTGAPQPIGARQLAELGIRPVLSVKTAISSTPGG